MFGNWHHRPPALSLTRLNTIAPTSSRTHLLVRTSSCQVVSKRLWLLDATQSLRKDRKGTQVGGSQGLIPYYETKKPQILNRNSSSSCYMSKVISLLAGDACLVMSAAARESGLTGISWSSVAVGLVSAIVRMTALSHVKTRCRLGTLVKSANVFVTTPLGTRDNRAVFALLLSVIICGTRKPGERLNFPNVERTLMLSWKQIWRCCLVAWSRKTLRWDLCGRVACIVDDDEERWLAE